MPMAQRSEANSQTAASSPSELAGSQAASIADAIAAGSAAGGVEPYVKQLLAAAGPTAGVQDKDEESATRLAAAVIEALTAQKPDLLAPHIESLIRVLTSAAPGSSPGAHASAHCLPVLARVVPAKVAKHLKGMQAMLPAGTAVAQDGLVRTFVALCVASVTYQKRLIDSFEMALRTASVQQLPAWVEHILPALKGEPYAQARAVVEQRLLDPELPRELAQGVADFLGIKLRPLPERR